MLHVIQENGKKRRGEEKMLSLASDKLPGTFCTQNKTPFCVCK
jgi:hypothetical protein